MNRLFAIFLSIVFLACVTAPHVYAGGGKNQHEIGAPSAPGPGADKQGNQAG